ncbi:DUF4252 domain-containing protein [Chryseobacterium daecheongense]|uniref:Autotransporter adhesin-like protein n=1 Tax=Chryseobacterium daecheongense TaxID=192389 RepID=A0A3N0VY70_9FLAO|nr:DUF4252 domain-containing protein [Chryseobacterium daecheongense]ROH96818.1 DUF4252 domain-containing protein [Chryseobacterium daecheongense]TDX90833.1 putative autotransporter adhesin-like protein [Chryseobacterium daecheongense]
MKKILIIFALAFSHFFNMYGQEDKFDKLFDKYQEVEGVTSIKIAKPMFGMLSSLDIDDAQLDQIKPFLSKIDGLKVLITENPEDSHTEDGMKVQSNLSQLSKDISSYLKNLNYSEIMTVNNSGAKIKFLSSKAIDGMVDDLLLSINAGGGENILVKLDGKLSMDDINKIINSSETKTKISNTRSNLTSDNTSSYLNGESRNVGEFSGIQVSTGVNVVFKQESPSNVKVIADADKLQYVITKVENGILKVYVDNKGVKNLKFKNLSVNVSSPKMNEIKASSGSTFTTINSVNENSMVLDASSGAAINGKFNISNSTQVDATSGAVIKANLTSKDVTVRCSSGSNTNFEGQAGTAIFDVSSGALCKADNLRVNKVEAESTSGGNLSVHVVDRLKVKASSGGLVKYKGNPEIDSNISKVSGGTLKPIN